MWSVIVRISLNKDTGSKILAKYKPILTKCGFTQFGATGSWRVDNASIQDATNTLHEILNIMSDPQGNVKNVPAKAALDHMWIYIEKST